MRTKSEHSNEAQRLALSLDVNISLRENVPKHGCLPRQYRFDRAHIAEEIEEMSDLASSMSASGASAPGPDDFRNGKEDSGESDRDS